MNAALPLKKIKYLLAFLLFLGLLLVHFYIPRFITEVKNPILGLVRGEYSSEENFDSDPAFEGKSLSVETDDKNILSAYLTFSQTDTVKGTVILLHGIRSRKEHFVPISKFLAKNGYNSIAVDLRAHGESTGKYCTFGVKEKNDIKSLIDYLITNDEPTGEIGVWGQSLGAAVALQTMAIDDRIQFGIIESTFTDFRTIANDYFKFHLGFNIPIFTNYLVNRAGKISNFDPDDAVPIESCKKIEQRVLIVHGDEDRRIIIKYGLENFRNIKSAQKQFLTVEGAAHLEVWDVGGDSYFQEVLNFLTP